MKESYNQPNLSNDQKLKEHAKRKAIEAVKNSKVSKERRDSGKSYGNILFLMNTTVKKN